MLKDLASASLKFINRGQYILSLLIFHIGQMHWLVKKWQGKTTSLIERIMRTVNLGVNVGKWSTQGVLNVIKVRLAYYYNGFNPQLVPWIFKLINGISRKGT